MKKKWYDIKAGYRPDGTCWVVVCKLFSRTHDWHVYGRYPGDVEKREYVRYAGLYRTYTYDDDFDVLKGGDGQTQKMESYDFFFILPDVPGISEDGRYLGDVCAVKRGGDWLHSRVAWRERTYRHGVFRSGDTYTLREKGVDYMDGK